MKLKSPDQAPWRAAEGWAKSSSKKTPGFGTSSNYGTHKHAKVQAWLQKHARFHLHFIPTSSSWLNLVERWFAELTNKAVRRGSFQSVPDLIEKIMEFIAAHNEQAKAFVWTATAEAILAKIERCRKRLEEVSPGCTNRKKRKVA